MTKVGSIFILLWMLFSMLSHVFHYVDNDTVTFLYFGGNDLAICGFALLLYSIRDKINFTFLNRRRRRRLFLIVLIYSLWCLVVDICILMGIGAHDTALYTSMDITILSAGTLWIFV